MACRIRDNEIGVGILRVLFGHWKHSGGYLILRVPSCSLRDLLYNASVRSLIGLADLG